MSASVAAEECTALGATQGTLEAHPNRDVSLGALSVTRVLPIRDRRMVGPWCFLDRFGALQEIASFERTGRRGDALATWRPARGAGSPPRSWPGSPVPAR